MSEQNAPVRILFLDDEQPILNSLRRVLRKEGYEISLCTDPDDALRIIRESSIEIVVSDHLMPGMTGTEFFALASRLHPHVYRIMLTGQADMDVAIRCINEGHVHRFLTKPWDDDQLKQILREAARQIQAQERVRHSELPSVGRTSSQASDVPVVDASSLLVDHGEAALSGLQRDESGVIVIDPESVGELELE